MWKPPQDEIVDSQWTPPADEMVHSGGVATENPPTTPTGLAKDGSFKEIYPRSRFATHGDYEEFHKKPILGATPETYPYTIAGMRKGSVSSTLHTALPMAGLVAGSEMGTPLLGGALLAGAGERVADVADMAMGRQPIPKLSELPGQGASALAEGALSAATAEILGFLGNGALMAFGGATNKAVAEKMAGVIQSAKENGIDLTPAQITGSRSLEFLERLFSKGLSGSKYAEDFHAKQLKQILTKRDALLEAGGAKSLEQVEALGKDAQKMVDDYVRNGVRVTGENIVGIKNQVLKQLGSTEEYYDLSRSAQEVRAQALEKSKAIVQRNYAEADALTPPDIKIIPNKFKEALKLVKGEISEAEKPLQESPIAKLVDDLDKNLNDGTPDEQARNFFELRRTSQLIGERAAAETNFNVGATSPSGRWYKILDEAISGENGDMADLMKEIKPLSPSAAAAQEAAKRSAYTRFEMMKDPVIKKMAEDKPEAIVKGLFGDATSIQRFKSITEGTNLFDRVKRKAATDLFDTGPGEQLNGQMILDRLDKYGERAQYIWSPEEVAQISGAAKAIDDTTLLGKELYGNRILKNVIKDTTFPEGVAKVIVRPNSPGSIRVLESFVGKEAKEKVAKAFLPEILLQGQAEGNFSGEIAQGVIDKYGEKTLTELYGPKVFGELKGFVSAAKYAQDVPQFSGAHVIGLRTALGIGSPFFLLSYGTRHPVATATIIGSLLVGPRIFSNLYFSSPLMRQFLLQGIKIPAWTKQGSALGAKLVAAATAQMMGDEDNPKGLK